MAQLSDDCFAFGGELVSTEAALAQLRERLIRVTETEAVPLLDALGRVLAEDVVADRSVPPHDNSAVDGYAVRFDDLDAAAETRLPVTGRAAAGHPLDRAARPGEAIRIFTGAVMPIGMDTVMMQEDCSETEDADGKRTVVIAPGIKRGANRREAGEDVRSGDTVLSAGHVLRPQDLGLAASLGRIDLPVSAQLRVALFSTGDEIAEPGGPAPEGFVYDSNRMTLRALLHGLGCAVEDLGILPDDRPRIQATLQDAAGRNDLIMTSGGMSVGEEDHLRAAVNAVGTVHFWRLAIKPGRPVAMGQIGATPFLGLPGNPVAVMVTFLRIARPTILLLCGATDVEPKLYRVRADFAHRKKKSRREWVRVRLATDEDGVQSAAKFPRDGAGILSSLVAADGLVELGEDVTQLEPGTMVDFLPFNEVI